MAYQATVIPVMIASPGDVSEEREVIREVIHDWNDVNAVASKTMLSPVGWETHSSPELGERPQKLINSRILKECDLLVGVFWTRLGTPTGKAESGTVEEIEEHINAGKPAMIYFSSKPVVPESIDPDQYSAVQNFKARCRELGLIEQFEDTNEFRSKFFKQLQITLIKNEYLKNLAVQSAEISLEMAAHVQQENNSYSLSDEAITLLKAATQKDDGTILKITFLGGKHIQAGGQSFGGDVGREFAKWENALNELVNEGLIVARGYKDQVFELTHKGWSLADKL